jgi:hypothetical protein
MWTNGWTSGPSGAGGASTGAANATDATAIAAHAASRRSFMTSPPAWQELAPSVRKAEAPRSSNLGAVRRIHFEGAGVHGFIREPLGESQ